MRNLALILTTLVLVSTHSIASASVFFAAGFSGDFVRSVAFGPKDELLACRATGAIGGGKSLRIERRVGDETMRLWLQSNSLAQVEEGPFRLLADGRAFPLPYAFATLGASVSNIPPEIADAASDADALELETDYARLPLPAGVVDALRFVRACSV
jgi:hypothetical protein